MALISLLLTKA